MWMLSRRNFLGLAGGVALLAACGGDDDAGGAGTDAGTDTLAHEHDEELTELAPRVVSSDLYASETPQRLAFVLLAKEGFASQGPARVAVAPEGSTPTAFVDTTLYEAGLPARRGVYVTEMMLDHAGIWDGVCDRDGEQLPFVFQVKAEADAPTIGAVAPADASPTVASSLGVDPICTRDPMCPLHEQSLETVIGKGKPTAVLFATPARCQTQYCGPVLDSLLPLVNSYAERVDIVHVDIFKNLRTTETSPTVTAWGLPSEPWLFGVDAAGRITGRLDGAFGQDEMRALLDALA
jgi:hypothetical protein